MEPTYGDYDVSTVEGIETLQQELVKINNMSDYSDVVEAVSDLLLNGHDGSSGYLSFGNNKVAKSTAIFNMNSATDCPNADTSENEQSETGACQVPWESCYAHKAEYMYPNALPKRRRQQYLWDNLDAETFAKAFLRVVERKRSTVDTIRFSESGDFRHESDIIKVNSIAKILKNHDIDVYTYSASHKLDWSYAEHFTVNQSNGLADYGDRLFTALPKGSDLPDGMVWCAYDISDGERKCGECKLCVNKEGPDVAIELH